MEFKEPFGKRLCSRRRPTPSNEKIPPIVVKLHGPSLESAHVGVEPLSGELAFGNQLVVSLFRLPGRDALLLWFLRIAMIWDVVDQSLFAVALTPTLDRELV